jgi:iron complex transport system substrate-binding protein
MRRTLFFLLVAIMACKEKSVEHEIQVQDTTAALELKYASGFRITRKGKFKEVEVMYPFQGATSGYKYLLVPKGEQVPQHAQDTRIVFTPVESIVCTSTTHIPLLDYLNETETLVGFPTLDYISSEKMRRRIDAGKVAELGIDKGMNLELLASMKPDLVMGYVMTRDYGQFKKMEDLNIPVVINAEYLEKHPLGRAEWIKFMAAFFDKEAFADSVFNSIEKSYVEAKALVDSVTVKPTVLSGIVYGDAWFLPGGQNYAAKILKDAGCNYLWASDSSHGFLQMSFEEVYSKGKDADLWIGTGPLNSLKELGSADHRYARFKPFENNQVYASDARRGVKGGSEFLELGYLRPDIILRDLIRIAHPDKLPNYELYFHKKLN